MKKMLSFSDRREKLYPGRQNGNWYLPGRSAFGGEPGSKGLSQHLSGIGFLLVSLNVTLPSHPLLNGFPPVLTLFQWHGNTFDSPEGAAQLATLEGCKNQVFVKGKCLGMQFHWEADERIIRNILEADRHELVQAPYIAEEEKILADLSNLDVITAYIFQLLGRVALL